MNVSNVGDGTTRKTGDATTHDKYIEKYARAPKSVGRDKEIDPYAFKVYCTLSQYVFQGNVAKLGQRRIAREANIHIQTVRKSLDLLADRGHIKIVASGNRRRMYCLLSNVFGSKQRDGLEEVAIGPSGQPRLVSAPRRRTA